MLFMVTRTPRLEENDDEQAAEVAFTARLFRRACERSALKQDTVAFWQGLTAARWNDQLTGRKQQHPSFRRLLRLRHDSDGRRYLRALAWETAVACGEDLRAVLGAALLERWDQLHVALGMADADRRKDVEAKQIALFRVAAEEAQARKTVAEQIELDKRIA
jgi:hypothetical protein